MPVVGCGWVGDRVPHVGVPLVHKAADVSKIVDSWRRSYGARFISSVIVLRPFMPGIEISHLIKADMSKIK